jgi:hypothetical protein
VDSRKSRKGTGMLGPPPPGGCRISAGCSRACSILVCQATLARRVQPISNHRSLYPSLYPSFIEFSTRFSLLYLISLQQHFLNLVLYTLNPILETYFVPIFVRTYLSYLKCYGHILFLFNSVFKT